MTNLEPLRNLLEAQDIYARRRGKVGQEESLKKLSSAVGSDQPLPLLGDNLDKVFEPGTPLNDIALHLALVETRKK